MHDIDRALFEAEAETEAYGETEFYEFHEAGQSGESYELALAAEFLELTTESELDQFLGKLLSKAVSAVGDFARSDAGRAVGGMVKSAAKQILPQVGQFVGNAIAPSAGGALGQRAGSRAGNKLELGLETEGLSGEDRQFETARAFVRFADEAAKRTAQAAGSAPPSVAAQRGAVAAAQRHLPGLLRTPAGPTGTAGSTGPPGIAPARAMEGRWVRRHNRIVVLDA
jgi:hypothetical protein